MDNKEKLKNIKLLSTFILNDTEYDKLFNLLENNKLNAARLLIDDLMEIKEIDIFTNSDNQIHVNEYKQLDNLQNLIIDLIVDVEVDEKEQQFEPNIK